MTDQDASFADGEPSNAKKLALIAEDADGLAVLSALLQDAVGKTSEIAWMPKARRFAMVINRFRWEEAGTAAETNQPYERVRAGFHIDDVLGVKSQGFDPNKAQEAFQLLALTFEPGEDGTGTLNVVCAGDAGFALSVETLSVTMADMDAVWQTQTLPEHDLGNAE